MASYKRKSKNFFIKKDLQGRIILAVFLAVIIGCLIFILLFGLFSADSLTISYENNDLQVGQTPMMLLKNAVAANWIFIILCGTLLVIAAIIGTHRIAGPLFRFEKAMDTMISKNLSDTIYLRKNDEGKDLANKINVFNQTISADIRQLSKNSRAINDLLNQYSSLDNASVSADEVASICAAIKKNNDKIRMIIGEYSLSDGQ